MLYDCCPCVMPHALDTDTRVATLALSRSRVTSRVGVTLRCPLITVSCELRCSRVRVDVTPHQTRVTPLSDASLLSCLLDLSTRPRLSTR